MPLTPRLLLCTSLCFLAIVVSAPARARACSEDAETGLGDLAVLPGDGSRAPTNTLVWIATTRYRPAYGEPAPNLVFTLRSADVGFPATARPIAVAGESETTLVVLTPSAPLPAGAWIDVIVSGDVPTELLARFQVTADEDREPPARPLIASATVASEYFGLWSCGDPSRVTLVAAPADQLLLIIRPGGAPFDVALAVGVGARATAVALAAGDHRLQVVAADLAGHLSAPSDELTVTVPPEVSGCTVGGAPSTPWPLVLALALLLTSPRRRWAPCPRAGAPAACPLPCPGLPAMGA